jgi:NTE family protein
MKKIIVGTFFYLICIVCNGQNRQWQNLVFEGAGIRGIAYAGVLQELDSAQILKNINKVAGTSAGALTALMVSLGYTYLEIYKHIDNTKFQKFNDGKYFFLGGMHRLNKKFGWYRGNELNNWIEKIIADKTGNKDITFKELHDKGYKQLFITGTCINKQKVIIFSAATYPNMKVKDAVRISMSIPLYFEAVFIDSTGKVFKQHAPNLDVVVDGGILANFPINIFDSIIVDSANNQTRIPNFKTIGVRIDSDLQIKYDEENNALAPITIRGMKDYIEAFYIIILENLNRKTLVAADWQRTISVSSVGINPKVKKLSSRQKAALINSGKKATKLFLNKYE